MNKKNNPKDKDPKKKKTYRKPGFKKHGKLGRMVVAMSLAG